MAGDTAEGLKQTAGKCIDHAIKWTISLAGIVFFTLLYLLLSVPMTLCWGCENLFGRSGKQSGIN
mgnify:CR=1 FL=1